MSWGRLPRPNPCLPCMVGNPKRRKKNAGDVSIHIDMPKAHAASGRGRTVERNANPSWPSQSGGREPMPGHRGDVVRPRGVKAGIALAESYMKDSLAGGRGAYGGFDAWIDIVAGGDMRTERAARAHYAKLLRQHGYGVKSRLPNPKLMVLNPSSGLAGAIERKLHRRLSSKEKSLLAAACREFKTFHGREAKAEDLVPVDVPPGTPMFVMGIGKVERQNYTVPMESERRGKWTHKAGDHGGKHETKAPWFASIPGRSKHNVVIAQPPGAKTYFKPTHGLMG